MSTRALVRLILSLFLLAFALPAGAATADKRLCAAAAARAELQHDIPVQLLQAIALVESGRGGLSRGEILAWPWTVMAEGKGRYLPSKPAAIAEVRALQKRGVENIDVGCMQINMKHHPGAFESLEEAFDPTDNVAFAAQFLLALRAETHSWTRAVGYYHSRRPLRANHYRRKVLKSWRQARHRANAGSARQTTSLQPAATRRTQQAQTPKPLSASLAFASPATAVPNPAVPSEAEAAAALPLTPPSFVAWPLHTIAE